MAKNSGKTFESEFQDSVPSQILCYRFKDGTGSWDGGTKTRFQSKNMCDFMVFNGKRLFLLELKSTKGKSIPLGNFKDNQIKELTEKSIFFHTNCGLLVKFADLERCFYLPIKEFNNFTDYNERKSIPVDYFEHKGIEVDMKLKKVRYDYNISKMLREIL